MLFSCGFIVIRSAICMYLPIVLQSYLTGFGIIMWLSGYITKTMTCMSDSGILFGMHCKYMLRKSHNTPLPYPYYQILNIVGFACAGNAGNVFPATDFKQKPLVSDHGMHHGTSCQDR